jgi:hypothetical protein
MGQSPEDLYAGADAWLEPAAGGTATGSILDSIISTGAGITAAVTSPDVVKSAMNKFIFGTATPYQTGTSVYTPAPTTGQIIPGVPNLYLLVGGAAILLLVLKKR